MVVCILPVRRPCLSPSVLICPIGAQPSKRDVQSLAESASAIRAARATVSSARGVGLRDRNVHEIVVRPGQGQALIGQGMNPLHLSPQAVQGYVRRKSPNN